VYLLLKFVDLGLLLIFILLLVFLGNLVRVLSKYADGLIGFLDQRDLCQYSCFELPLFLFISPLLDISDLEPLVFEEVCCCWPSVVIDV
jgi:hypothetical protein